MAKWNLIYTALSDFIQGISKNKIYIDQKPQFGLQFNIIVAEPQSISVFITCFFAKKSPELDIYLLKNIWVLLSMDPKGLLNYAYIFCFEFW